MTTDSTLMLVDPADCSPRPYPSHAGQWRRYNGRVAFLFNPWSGSRRSAADVGTDPFGLLIGTTGEPIFAPAKEIK